MWILSLIYNDTTSHRALRVNSTVKVGRNHDYRKDPGCVYIADLKVPKTYISVKVGEKNSDIDKPTSLSILFESICTTDINGNIYKLAKKDADPFEQSFTEKDLLIKVNANKSDKIKLRLLWVPVIILPFSKKISFDGIVQQSPLPETLSKLQASGIDLQTTDNPFNATHYVTLTDSLDYNLQIAVSRAIPVVSKTWCDFLATSIDDVDSWLFDIIPDFYIHDTRGNNILPNPARPKMLRGFVTAIVTDDIHSKQVAKLKKWLTYATGSEVIVKNVLEVKELQIEFEKTSSSHNYYLFRVLSSASEPSNVLEETNTVDNLWNAIVSVDCSKIQRFKPLALESFESEKHHLDQEKEPTPVSQRRKRRKLERVDDTNFFSFTPLSSSKTQPEILNSNTGFDSSVPKFSDSTPSFESAQASQPKVDDIPSKDLESDHSQVEMIIKNENETQAVSENAPEEKIDSTHVEKASRPRSDNELSESVSDVVLPPKKKQKSANWIVPEVSLADAVKSTKQQADDDIKQELEIDDSVEAQLGKLLVIEDFELQPPRRSTPVSSNNNFHGRKNFKNFRKNGPKQNNITRTFIELVDNGNDVYFQDQLTPPEEEIGHKLKNDFATEMEDVRGFQPEPPQLFVGDASDSDDDNAGESFQFSSRRADPSSASGSTSSLGFLNTNTNRGHVSDDDDDDDDDDGEVRFRFSRKS